ncbi:hypothetical protein EG329_002309 [Mollisiaceae sp. DMI_Dod_QoI]|nr:hypothetical protein EG329_002309 [Helotiales sp. DMI_Dod_QoI]
MTITATCPAGVASPNAPSVAISDVTSSELVEAVAALNMETSLTTPRRPLADPLQVEDPKEVDSGYASKSSTPENSNFRPFVITNTSLLPLTRRKKTKLTYFEKEIPKLTRNRFEDLRELYTDSLNNLASGISKRRGILMTLKVLGESEETAEPWVFIQCDKAIAKKVRRFFKQSSIVSDFKPPSPNIYTPKLDVYVHEFPPLLLGRDSPRSHKSKQPSPNLLESAELYYERDSSSQYSLCGTKVIVAVNGQWRSATIGGLISVETAEGYIEDFGITAGHFLNEDCYVESFDDEAQEEEEAGEEETDDDADDESFDDEQDFELDLGSMEEPSCTTSVHTPTAQIDAPSKLGSSAGHILWTSQKNLQDGPNLDWALFIFRNTVLKLPNIVMTDEITQINTEDLEETRAVVLSTASRGRTYGTLSSSWSYLALSPGNGLVRTKAVKFAKNQVLEPGDSGAWVVDLASNQLYGHVVASDVFGVSYIVPAFDVFRDIQLRLSFKTVKLPSSTFPIFEAQVPSTSGLSHDQGGKTHLNSPTTIAFHQSISEGSGNGHKLSDGGGLSAEAEDQAMVRHEKLFSPAPDNHSLESSKVKMGVSAFNEIQKHTEGNKPEPGHILPPAEAPNSVSRFAIPPPKAALTNSPILELDYSIIPQRIEFVPSMVPGIPELPAAFEHGASGSTNLGVVTDPTPLDRPIASGASRFQVSRSPPVVHELVVSDAPHHEAPTFKENILVRVLRKLGIRKNRSKAIHVLEAATTPKDHQKVPRPVSLPPKVPVKGFSDSGYSTMANTPAGSKVASPSNSRRPSPRATTPY